MQSKQYFTKIKNYPHEKSTEPIFCKKAINSAKKEDNNLFLKQVENQRYMDI